MRISTTTLESYRLFMQPDQEWMSEDELIASIRGQFVPNRKVLIGKAFGEVLETPDRYRISGGFQHGPFFFSSDTMQPALDLFDRRGVFEAKATKEYGDRTVVAKADQLLGSQLIENKTTCSTFDLDKYAQSYQWRYMAEIFEPTMITYRVFCLGDDESNQIELKSIEAFNLFPYGQLHQDCCALLDQFCAYVTAKGLDGYLRQRQAEAA